MKGNLLKRGLALITCVAICMTSVPNLAFAEERSIETKSETDMNDYLETKAETNLESHNETETQTKTEADIETKTETETETETEIETETETETETQIETEHESESETEKESELKEVKTADARVKIAWSDFENLGNRRNDREPSEFLTVYADGELMTVQPEILLERELPEKSYGIETYTYIIKDLPVTGEDGKAAISYTIREKAPKGYRAFSASDFKDADMSAGISMIETMASPEQEVALKWKEDESSYEGEKTFGNYLPAYRVEGTVLWKGRETDGQRPDIENYFKEQFTIVRNIDSENYTAFKLHYTQDENDDHRWNYRIEGLFTTASDGSGVSYQIRHENVDGYELHIENPEVAGDRSDVEAVYEVKDRMAAAVLALEGENTDTVTPKNYTEQILPILWIDNDLSKRPDIEVSVQFEIDGKIYDYNKENAAQYLGISEDEFKEITQKSNTGTYDVYVLNVPVTVTLADNDKAVTWTLTPKLDTDKASGYIIPDDVEDRDGYKGVYIYREKSDVSFIIDIKNGDLKEDFSAFAGDIYLYKQIEPSLIGNIASGSTSRPNIRVNADGTYKVTFEHLPRFTDDKTEIIYFLKTRDDAVGGDAEGSDYYKVSYDNTASSNFGNNHTECHDKGTLELTLTGTTDYMAEKIWLDDGTEEQRPKGILWSLWRYSGKEGTSYKEASQVTDDQGENRTWAVAAEETFQECIFDNLEKYDPEGYPYVYLSREMMNGSSYEQVHLAAYEQNSGRVTKITEEERSDVGDQSIYDGDILANRITGQTNTVWKKVWYASHYQNDLSGVDVTLQLQRRPESIQEQQRLSADWEDVQDKTQVVNNFIAENLIQTGSVSVDKYDELGLPQEYRWIESMITEDGRGIDIGSDGRFELSHNSDPINMSLNGNDEEYYVSEVKTETIEDPENPGSQICQTVITNRLKGTTTYTVDKLWAQLDGEGAVQKDEEGKTIYGKNAPAGASVEVLLYQDRQPYKAEGTDGELLYTLNSENSFYHEYMSLPKYDEWGREYTYEAKEKSCSPAWHVNVNYNVMSENNDGITTYYDMQMKNTPTGRGNTVRISKAWLDDGEENHRQDVTVALYRKAQSGESEDHHFGNYILKAADHWHMEVGVTEYEDDGTTIKNFGLDQYYIREVGLGNGSSVDYDIYNSGADFDADQGGAPKLKDTIDQVTAYLNDESLIYEAYYDIDKANNELTVVNRRVGTINLSVTKKWLDGDDEDQNRPDDVTLAVRAVSDGYSSDSIIIDETDGTVTVKDAIGGSGVHEIQDKDGIKTGAVQALTPEDGITYEFYNLPKYDALGRVIHYTVEERGLMAPYRGSLVKTGYDASFADDTQKMELTNKRSDTKTPVFHKIWKDQYNYETGRRPDIYFTLYSATRDTDGSYVVEEVKPYPNRTWVHTSNMEWSCVFDGGLPRYDENGFEIFYYATEGSQVNMAAFDYLPEEFYTDAGLLTKSEKYAVNDGSGYKLSDTAGDDGFQILPEDGCFVNRIQKNIIVSGQKVWKNIPSGFPVEDFPKLKMNLYRVITPTVDGTNRLTFREALDNVVKKAVGSADTVTEDLVAWTTELNRINATTNTFTFMMDVEGDNEAKTDDPDYLKKYDEEGRLYYYTIKEEVLDSNENLQITYEKLPGEVNDFIVTNAYEINDEKNTGHLEVRKSWSGIDDFSKYSYPAARFKLYRQYVSKDVSQNTETVYYDGQEISVTKQELVDTKTVKSSQTDTGTVQFDCAKLRIYAPNGTKYYYFIEEDLLLGYNYDDTEKVYKQQTSEVFRLETGKTEFLPQEIEFSNEYQPGKEIVSMTGQKIWVDHSNTFQTRPTLDAFKAEVKFYRYADAQNLSGGAGAIPEEELILQDKDSTQSNYLQWTETDQNTWTYTVTNLDRYAPNAMPWKYVVEEGEVSGYRDASSNSGTVNPNDGRADSSNGKVDSVSGNITLPALTNTFYKYAQVTKSWPQDNAYNLRPTQIGVKLQFYLDNERVWQDADFENFQKAGYTGTKEDLPIQLEYQVKSPSWSLTVDNLPSTINGKNVCYRFIESSIGAGTDNEPKFEVSSQDPTAENITYNPVGGYQPSQRQTIVFGVDMTDSTQITNSFSDDGLTSLKVIKEWEDSDNTYNTRPENRDGSRWEITIKLQRTVDDPRSATVWEDVRDVKGEVIYRQISDVVKSPQATEVTFEHLPLRDTDGKEYFYRAVETTQTDGYEVSYETAPHNTTTKYDSTIIKNTLKTTSLSVEKQWKTADGKEQASLGSGRTIRFEIKKVTDGKEIPFETPQILELNGSESTPWTKTVSNLPELTGVTYVARELEVPSGFWKTEEINKNNAPDAHPVYTEVITNTQTEFLLDKTGFDANEQEISLSHNYTVKYEIWWSDGDAGPNPMFTWTRQKTGDKIIETLEKNPAANEKEKKLMENLEVFTAADATNGSIPIRGLGEGNYFLKESAAPEGYERNPDEIKFTITKSGEVKLQSTIGKEVSLDGKKIILKDEPIKLTLKKTAVRGTDSIDSKGNCAEFKITGTFADGTSEKTGVTSENIGSLDGQWIAGNPYTFTETKAPAGYELAAPFTIFIGDDGKIVTITSDAISNPASGIGTEMLTVSDKPIEIQIVKTNADGSENLEGSEFCLDDYGIEGNTTGTPVQSVTFVCINGVFSKVEDKTDSAKQIVITQGHTYKLTETKAPAGYVLPQDTNGHLTLSREFKVEADGKLTGTSDNQVTINQEDAVISVKNVPIRLTLTKEDSELSTVKLFGAEFDLYEGNSEAGSPILDSIATSDGTGDGVLGTVMFPEEGSDVLLKATYDTANPVYYTLKETTAPLGYEQIAAPLVFYITPAGKMVFAESAQYVGNQTSELTVKNTKTEIALEKRGQDAGAGASPMNNVSLTIYEQNAGGTRGTEVLTWTRDNDGAIAITRLSTEHKYDSVDTGDTSGIKGLPAGDYILAEDTAPDDYLKILDTPFTVKPDGTITGTSTTGANGSSYVTFGDDKHSITVTDTKIRSDVKLTKYLGAEADKKTLEGVKFDLYRVDEEHSSGVKIAENLVTDAQGVMAVKGQKDTIRFLETAGSDQGQKVNIGLPAGTYYLQESGATADSVLDESNRVGFVIERDESKKSEQPQTIVAKAENTVFQAEVIFQKTDGSDKTPLENAIFKLKYVPAVPAGKALGYDGDSAHTYVSDDKGMIRISGLRKGFYELYEVSAQGYQMTENEAEGKFKCTFKIVDADHGKTLKLDETTGFKVTSGKGRESTDQTEYQAENTRIKGSVAIKKISNDAAPLSLNGAEFKLTKIKEANGTSIADPVPHIFTFVSGKNYKADGNSFTEDTDTVSGEGILKISGLDWGTYTLKETKAPKGYKLEDKTVTFEVKRDMLNLTAESNGHRVTNVRTAITLKKNDVSNASALLPGAEFRIEPLTETDAFAGDWKDDRSKTIVMDDDVTRDGIYLLEGRLIGGNSYRLTETKAPLGYEIPKGNAAETIFKVNENGTIDGGQNISDVIVSDKKIALNLRKQDADGTDISEAVLNGTTFTIQGLFKTAEGTIEEQNVEIVAAGGTFDLTSMDGRWLATCGTAEGTDQFTYTVTETVAPEGYELPEVASHTFTVDIFGNVIMTNDGTFSGTGETITVKDPKIEVNILKTDENGSVIGDEARGYAEFSVRGIFAGETEENRIEGSAEITNDISDLQNKLSGRLVAGNSYTLTEIKAPDGYMLPNPALTAIFTVDADGKVWLTDDAGGKVSVDNGAKGVAVISAEDSPVALSLTKSDIDDANDESITGRGEAEFEVTPATDTDTFADGSRAAVTVTTADNGMDALTGKLRPNVSYILTETVAPKGYQLAEPFTFMVDAQGRIILENTPVQADAQNSDLTVKDKKIEVKLRKISSQDDKTAIELAGAVFAVTPKPGSEFAVAVTDNKITVSGEQKNALNGMLVAGNSYILEEITAPKGYKIGENIEFTVDADGKASIVSETAEAEVISDGDSEIMSVKNTPIEIFFLKRFVGDKVDTGVAGAEFTLTPENGKTFADGSKKIVFTSGEEAERLNGKLIGGDVYKLTETKAPEGSMTCAENGAETCSFTFKMDDYGQVQGVKADSEANGVMITYEETSDRITVWNEPTVLTIQKRDMSALGNSDDPMLAGCTFAVTGRFAAGRYNWPGSVTKTEGKETILLTTNGEDNGENLLKGRLIVGETYQIEEISAPAGYELGLSITFTITGVHRNIFGKPVLAIELSGETGEKGNNGYWFSYDSEGNPVITQRDEPVEVKLQKTDMEGSSLAGAEFQITGSFADGGGEESRTFKADSHGQVDLSRLLMESQKDTDYIYRIRETKAPAGYTGLEGDIVFKLVSEQQSDGKRRTVIQILYGKGMTPESYKDYLKAAAASDNREIQILSIANPKTQEDIPVNQGSGAKTGDMSNIGFCIMMLLVSGTLLISEIKKRKKY